MKRQNEQTRVRLRPLGWYLRSWEYQEVDGKRRLVYTGEYYRLTLSPQALRRTRWLAAALYLLLAAVYLGFETTLSQGGLAWYSGAPCLLALIPLFYLGLGIWNLLRAEERFTYRRQQAIFLRLRLGGWGTFSLLALGSIGQLVFILQYGSLIPREPELIQLFGSLTGAALAAGLLILTKRIRYEEVYPGETPGTRR